jgi:hypothetical protein
MVTGTVAVTRTNSTSRCRRPGMRGCRSRPHKVMCTCRLHDGHCWNSRAVVGGIPMWPAPEEAWEQYEWGKLCPELASCSGAPLIPFPFWIYRSSLESCTHLWRILIVAAAGLLWFARGVHSPALCARLYVKKQLYRLLIRIHDIRQHQSVPS